MDIILSSLHYLLNNMKPLFQSSVVRKLCKRYGFQYIQVANIFTSTIDSANYQLTATGLIETTSVLDIRNTLLDSKWPVFRVLEPDGSIAKGAPIPEIDKDTAVRMYKTMCSVQAVDDIFYNAQRQGRISFYMQNIGEEGIQIGFNISSLQ